MMPNNTHGPTQAAPAADAAAAAPLTPAERPPASTYDVALLDLDGVVYSGSQAIPGAVDALAAAREAGLRLAFVTNNASRSPSAIAEHLSGLGVATTSADVVTSAQAAATLIASRFPAGSAVLVAGSNALRLAVRERGLRPVSLAGDHPVAVVQGYAPDMNYGLLAEAGVAVRDGAFYVATNSDSTLPTPRGPQPGNGSLLQVIITATGTRPVVAGKPETPLHAEAVTRTGARHPLIVGDRLDTDIEGAVRGGTDSMLVLTGVTSPRDAVLAPVGRRPTYIAAGLGGLLDRQPALGHWQGDETTHGVGRDASLADQVDGRAPVAFRYGGWRARLPGGSEPIELTGHGAWIDGLRVLCAIAWSAGQISGVMADPALAVLGRPS